MYMQHLIVHSHGPTITIKCVSAAADCVCNRRHCFMIRTTMSKNRAPDRRPPFSQCTHEYSHSLLRSPVVCCCVWLTAVYIVIHCSLCHTAAISSVMAREKYYKVKTRYPCTQIKLNPSGKPSGVNLVNSLSGYRPPGINFHNPGTP